MQRVVQLLQELDHTNSTLKKVASLRAYFSEASSRDAAWTLYLISGRKVASKLTRTFIHEAFCEFMQMPLWLFKESASHVGDASEAMALIRGPLENPTAPPAIGEFIETEVVGIGKLPAPEIKARLFSWWRSFDEKTLFLIHKCFSGNFRMGVSQNLLTEALSQVAGVDKETMTFRLMGEIAPTTEFYNGLLSPPQGQERKSKPYPFFLASQVETPEEVFSSWEAWCVEWKWDGIRLQVVKREGEVFLWSRGEELINDSFPDVVEQAQFLPDGTVIDGELLPMKGEEVYSFNELQRRLGRKRVTKKDLETTPVSVMAYDLLEWEGVDLRELPLLQRRELLEAQQAFPLSKIISVENLEEARTLRLESRDRGVEGFMLKRWDSPYLSGRKRGNWWKWKIDPLTIDCVLLYAQSGSGRRSGLYTDYTLAVWKEDELVPVTKAYSGLSDEELASMDHWIKRNTVEKFGPVRSVKPMQVFEIAFEGIQESKRHKAGVALRFPRIARWRKDKPPEEADSLDDLTRLL